MIPAVLSSSSRQPTMSYRELHPFVLHSTPCAPFAPLQQLLRFGLFLGLHLLLTPTTTNSQSLPSQAHCALFRFIYVLIPSALCSPFGCCVWLACDTHSASCLSWCLCLPQTARPQRLQTTPFIASAFASTSWRLLSSVGLIVKKVKLSSSVYSYKFTDLDQTFILVNMLALKE